MGRNGGDGGNIFEGVPEGPLPDELLTELLVAPGLRVARGHRLQAPEQVGVAAPCAAAAPGTALASAL